MVISPRYVIPDLIIIKRITIGFYLGLGLIDLLVKISQKIKNLDKSPQIVIMLSKK